MDGIRVITLDDETLTLAEIAEIVAEINEVGEHIFFDTATLAYPLYLCTIAINYDENENPVSYRLNDLVSGNISMGVYNGDKTLADILEEATSAFYTLIVTAVTQDGVTVTGQTVTVRANSIDGPIYTTAIYNGQPVSFSVPNGFAYYVSISSNLAGHFNPTVASGIVSGTDISVTLTYSDIHTIQTFEDVQTALNNGVDLTDLVGQQVSWTSVRGTEYWDVVNYDTTDNPEIMLCMHSVLGTNMMFDPPQALIYCENELPADDYTFANGNNHYYFTLTKAIPAGGQLRATSSQFFTYDSINAIASSESGTVSATEIAGATDLGICATGNLNHLDRVNYGSNNYGESWLLQYLNSDCENGALLRGITKFDRPLNTPMAGFLNGVSASTLACIADATWKCSANNVYEAPASMGGIATKQTNYIVQKKIGLLSEKEVFDSYGGTDAGDNLLDLYTEAESADRIKYYGTGTRNWWLRSPNWNNANNVRNVNTSGSANNNNANNTYGVAADCENNVNK